MEPGPAPRARIPALVAIALALLSCGRLSPRSTMTENQRPEITLTATTFGADGPTFAWCAHDPDGRVDHYIYALDPASVDRVDASWVRTNQMRALIKSSQGAAIGRASPTGKEQKRAQIFTVRAVDDRGGGSAPAAVAFFDTGTAPIVFIDNPDPNSVFTPIVPTAFTIQWHGTDLDGRITQYKLRVFGRKNPDFPEVPDFVALVRANPDTLDALYGPDFASWTEVAGNVNSQSYSNFVPDDLYVFAITAVDDDGQYSPVFSNSTNVVTFAVSNEIGAPSFCVQSSLFNYCNQASGDVDLSYEIPTQPLEIGWLALPQPGTLITGYRWTLDPKDTSNLAGEKKGPNHWTAWGLQNTSTTVGPFPAASEHHLYVQARDNVGHAATLHLSLAVVGAQPTRQLLVVDDTRLTPDQVDPATGYLTPRGTWPTAAELDTFLYARGGKPWQGYPDGTLSSPGILNGYDFDTVGTRGNTSGIVPLSLLSQYRQVMWFTDAVGAKYIGSPIELLAPITSLRLMSLPGQYNTLSAYVAQGGKLWLSGGGAAYATLIAWGRRNTPADDWTNTDKELIPGRFMYDFPHWRSSVGIRPARQALINTADWAPYEWNSSPTIGRGWSGQGMDNNLSQPNYNTLVNNPQVSMVSLNPRTCVSDPPPPLRACNSFYLAASYLAEFIGRVAPNPSPPNFVREDADPHQNKERLESTLDTLYTAVGGSMPVQLPVMTYYHGFESAPMVFSGFPIWYFQRKQCQQLVDFVLHDIWGLNKQAPASSAALTSRRR